MVKVGDKIRIIFMNGEPQYSGKIGSWGGCALIPGTDKFEIIKD